MNPELLIIQLQSGEVLYIIVSNKFLKRMNRWIRIRSLLKDSSTI
jgi:hypothetical protein